MGFIEFSIIDVKVNYWWIGGDLIWLVKCTFTLIGQSVMRFCLWYALVFISYNILIKSFNLIIFCYVTIYLVVDFTIIYNKHTASLNYKVSANADYKRKRNPKMQITNGQSRETSNMFINSWYLQAIFARTRTRQKYPIRTWSFT